MSTWRGHRGIGTAAFRLDYRSTQKAIHVSLTRRLTYATGGGARWLSCAADPRILMRLKARARVGVFFWGGGGIEETRMDDGR